MRLKLPFSPSFLCHSTAVAPLLLSICPGIPPTLPPVPRIEETARNFSALCRIAARASPVLQSSRQRKKDTPQSLLKLSEVSPFCHRVNWNGFLERMFFPAHYSTVISCFQSVTVILLPSVLCLCSRMPIFPAKFRPCAFQMLSGYFPPYSIEKRTTSLKLPFSMNWEIFYPILKSESILSSHSSERCSLSYSFARSALSSALSDSSTNFTAVLMMVWHA